MHVFKEILDWAEVWALLFPLRTLSRLRKQPHSFKPVIIYLWLAFCINLLIDIIASFKLILHFPPWLQSNNYLYNVHSIIRFVCFASFFILLQPYFMATQKKLLFLGFIVFVCINFTIFENFFYYKSFSSLLLATEAGLLLCYCLLYYLFKLKQEAENISKPADFWIVTGLSIYVVINFFYFLFYNLLLEKDKKFLMSMWYIHNIAYLILCLFIAKAFLPSPLVKVDKQA